MSWEKFDNIKGPKGDPGPVGTVANVTVTTRNAGSGATAEISGSGASSVLKLGIPRGDQGLRGPAGTIASASAESVAAGENAAVIMSGTMDVKHAHFRVPRGLPGVNAVPADEAVAAYLGSVDTESRAALVDAVAEIAPPANLRHATRAPIYIAHRGGANVYPEHSREAYLAAHAAGFAPEVDVMQLADGTLVCHHDATTGRTLTGPNVNVNTLTEAEWRARRVLPTSGPDLKTSRYGSTMTLDDYFDLFGGKGLQHLEIKNPTPIQDVIDVVKARNLERSVVLHSNTRPYAERIAAEGIYAGYVTSTTTHTPESLAQAGITYLSVSLGVGAAYVGDAVAAGLTVLGWTANTLTTAAEFLSWGCHGVYSDDPWLVSGRGMNRTMSENDGYLLPDTSVNVGGKTGGASYLHLRGDEYYLYNSPQPPWNRIGVKLGAFGVGGGTARIYLTVRGLKSFPSATANQAWLFGVYLGSQNGGEAITEQGAFKCKLAMVRRSGRKQAYLVPSEGAAAQDLGHIDEPLPYDDPLGELPEMRFLVIFNNTHTQIHNLTLGDAPLIVECPSLSGDDNYVSIGINQSQAAISRIEVVR